MKRYLILGISAILIAVGIFLLVQVASGVKTTGFGALQVTSNIKATVTLDGKSLGPTPLCKCDQNDTLRSGEYTLVVTPDDTTQTPFTTKVKIEAGVLTAVERTFLPGALASSYVLSLEKNNGQNAEVFIASLPDGAMITIDGNPQGATPFSQKSISASEHEIEIQKAGFAKKTLKIRTVKGYRLIANVMLGTDVPVPTTPSPTPSSSVSPTPLTQNTVKILTTPTGFLRVRAQASVGSAEVGRVNPGETYPFTDEQTGWIKIKLTNGTEGWISNQYAQKL